MIEICSSVSNNSKILLNKKAEKPVILGKLSKFSENANVLCHNFCCDATILVWKVALESLYKQLSNEIKIGTTGTEDIRQTKKCSFQL